MKLGGAAAERFLANPDPDIAAVLVYGPDRGLVAERSAAIGQAHVADLSDPFSVAELGTAALKDDPARLGDEARAVPFGGGNRLIRLKDATDAAATTLRDYLDDPAPGALVVAEAGEPGPGSSLRKLFEGHARAAAMACYTAEGRELEKHITGILTDLNASIERDALQILSASLGADRGLVRRELEKLALYAGDGARISEADVMACVVSSADVSLDRLAFAVADGNAREADALLQKAAAQGISEVAVLRALQRHFQRLERVVSQSEQGAPVAGLVAGLRPPVFFKFKARFEHQAARWSSAGLRKALGVLVEAEISCKSSGQPAGLICGRAVLALSRPA